jgi:dTDP-glucose 4,6-dehydratase
MDRILITGGCGFIGSNFVRHMIENSDAFLVNLDALTYAGNLENLKGIEKNPRYKFVYGRIEDAEMVAKVLRDEKITHVVHFAAETHVDRSIMDSTPFSRTNIIGTHVLLDVAMKTGVERFVHISTDEVYGSLGPVGSFCETTPLSPNSPYSATKAGSDMLVLSYVHTFKFPAVIIRCSNNYGPYQFPEKFIPLSISNAIDGQSIPLYGDGLNVRDWIYVRDFCSAIETVLYKGRVGEAYNAGGNAEKTNVELLKTILASLNKPESLIKFVKDRPGHDRRYAMDATKMKTEFGWMPKYKFEEGIQKTVEWYTHNNEWWKRIKSGEYQNYYKSLYGA